MSLAQTQDAQTLRTQPAPCPQPGSHGFPLIGDNEVTQSKTEKGRQRQRQSEKQTPSLERTGLGAKLGVIPKSATRWSWRETPRLPHLGRKSKPCSQRRR